MMGRKATAETDGRWQRGEQAEGRCPQEIKKVQEGSKAFEERNGGKKIIGGVLSLRHVCIGRPLACPLMYSIDIDIDMRMDQRSYHAKKTNIVFCA